jgi:hypothetical protein
VVCLSRTRVEFRSRNFNWHARRILEPPIADEDYYSSHNLSTPTKPQEDSSGVDPSRYV